MIARVYILMIGMLSTLLSVSFTCAQPSRKVSIACIGASITYGAGLEDREKQSYPAQLQNLLGDHYTVTNYGVNSTTLLRQGDHPYWSTKAYASALASNPDIVFIDLGGNDSKLVNRVNAGALEQDGRDLIQSFRQLPSHPRVILLLPIVSFVTDTMEIWDAAIVKTIIPHLRNVAFDAGCEVLDMHPLLLNQSAYMPDKIHPDAVGALMMAKRLHAFLTQDYDERFDIFKTLKPENLQSFYGYACSEFTMEGHPCKIVQPKRAAKHHPWIWRARFWGHEPQTDIALLERGFHVVYCDVAELFGNAEAVQRWNTFYETLTKNGLFRKVALEGMSRGAVYCYNWAAANPDKVVCVYVDNPVLDLKSWPGSQRTKTERPEWEMFKKDFGLVSDEAALAFQGSPIDKVALIVNGHYPLLHVCGDADRDVPMIENTTPFEQKVKALHGDITVIHKPGFAHHPHSLPDPSPIVDFIMTAWNTYR
ncbi:GDSL-type esterase/lipase family protein [Chryseolinea soli]|nr:GDSL-type esterase/lipase family protein [Chryseolinea soli]